MPQSSSWRGGVPALARGRETRRMKVGGVGRDPIPLTLQDLVRGRDAAVAARTILNRRAKAKRLILELNRQLDVRPVLPGGGDDFFKGDFLLGEKAPYHAIVGAHVARGGLAPDVMKRQTGRRGGAGEPPVLSSLPRELVPRPSAWQPRSRSAGTIATMSCTVRFFTEKSTQNLALANAFGP